MAYRARSEVENWKTRHNPVTRLKVWLEGKGLWNEEMDQEARSSIRAAVLRELVEAEKLPKPKLSGIFDDVYAELTEEAEEQREVMMRLVTKYPEEYDISTHVDGIKGL